MALLTVKLAEVIQIGDNIAARFELPDSYHPQPGQYLPCQRLSAEYETSYHALFNVYTQIDHLFLGPIPSQWQPGDRFACLPPHGIGFQMPAVARRVGLLALDGQPLQILPLIDVALTQNAAVALFFEERPHTAILDWIPDSVEISHLSALKENLDWPDFLAVEITRDHLVDLTSILGDDPIPFPGQVLVKTAMPCRGIGECGVCAVKTTHGWRHACQDGPVFPLKELLHVAG